MNLNKLATTILLIAVLPIIHFGLNLKPLNQFDLVTKFSQIDIPVSQDLVIIEIDDESLKHYNSWPWKRGIYAQLIEKLAAAYPKMVVFDIDFSSTSTLAEDFKLANAFEQAQFPIVLPAVITAAQYNAVGAVSYTENKPIELFAQHVSLANANALPDETGQVFKYAITADNGRPSLAAIMADKPFKTDGSIWIDYSQDPYTFPTYSVKDILEGNFNAAKIAGKSFIIGSTAIDLGDMYGLPKYGRLPGVYVHALAFETLQAGQLLQTIDTNIILIISVLLLLSLTFAFGKTKLAYALVINVAAALSIYVASVILHHFYQLILPTSLPFIAVLISMVYYVLRSLRHRTEKYFIEKNRNNFNKALINHMIRDNSNGIVITNARGELLVANQKAQQIFSIDKSAIKNRELVFQFIADSQTLFQNINQPEGASQPLEIVEQTVKNQSGLECSFFR